MSMPNSCLAELSLNYMFSLSRALGAEHHGVSILHLDESQYWGLGAKPQTSR